VIDCMLNLISTGEKPNRAMHEMVWEGVRFTGPATAVPNRIGILPSALLSACRRRFAILAPRAGKPGDEIRAIPHGFVPAAAPGHGARDNGLHGEPQAAMWFVTLPYRRHGCAPRSGRPIAQPITRWAGSGTSPATSGFTRPWSTVRLPRSMQRADATEVSLFTATGSWRRPRAMCRLGRSG
jgi:hypothetical protein